MKSNSLYIFDKITRRAPASPEGGELDRAALIGLAMSIGAADRGVAISAEKARLIADAVLASRPGSQADLRQLRASLNHDGQSLAGAKEPHAQSSAPTGPAGDIATSVFNKRLRTR